jgi:hypothetical protein
MVQPMIEPAAADLITAAAVVVEQDRRVVPLSPWLADAAVAARTSGRLLQLVTGPDSRLTYPLEALLTQDGGQWVVRDRGHVRDGFTGSELAWTGDRFAAVPGAGPAVGPALLDVVPGSGSLEVQISTRHPATGAVSLGAGTESAIRALTGRPPAGWGVAEPVTQPWSRREVTAHCRGRTPAPTALVVIGGPGDRTAVGVLRVERTDTGVLERFRLAGPSSGAVGTEAIEDLAAAVADTARSMIVAVHPTRSDGTLPAGPSLPALPYGILFGPEVVADRGIGHAQAAPAAAVRVLGPGHRRAVWCRLGTPDAAPFEVLTAVLRHFGVVDPEP